MIRLGAAALAVITFAAVTAAYGQTQPDAVGAAPSVAPPVSSQQSVSAPAATPSPAAGVAATVPDAPGDHIPPPPNGKGQVIFFRKGGYYGSLISCAVYENKVKLTSLPGGHFAAVDVDPGIHVFSVSSESTDLLRMEIEAGKLYYAQCGVSMGIMVGRPKLEPSDKATFFGYALKLKPVKDETVSQAH